jgi:hypothetical protein
LLFVMSDPFFHFFQKGPEALEGLRSEGLRSEWLLTENLELKTRYFVLWGGQATKRSVFLLKE